MKILDKFFLKSVKNDEPEDVMKISEIIGPLIDKISNEIFRAYREKLLSEPITYIVPAVWGAKEAGELDSAQKEMTQQIAPVVNEIFAALKLKGLSGSQEFAVAFLIRGYIISRIIYMIEGLKRRSLNKTYLEDEGPKIIDSIEPLGNA